MHSSTTILIRLVHITCTSASYDLPIGLKGKIWWAILPQISITASSATIACTIKSFNDHRQVKTIYKANIIIIDFSKVKLGDGGGRATRASAIEGAATATGLACAIAIFVEFATGSSPNASTPPR